MTKDASFQVNYEDLAVIVLENKISFSNGVTPICIDWYDKYNVRDGVFGKVNLLYNIPSL